jgi:hypothetical protein
MKSLCRHGPRKNVHQKDLFSFFRLEGRSFGETPCWCRQCCPFARIFRSLSSSVLALPHCSRGAEKPLRNSTWAIWTQNRSKMYRKSPRRCWKNHRTGLPKLLNFKDFPNYIHNRILKQSTLKEASLKLKIFLY